MLLGSILISELCAILLNPIMMNIKLYTLLQLLNQTETDDLTGRLNDFKKFTSTLIDFTDNLHTAQIKTEYWKQYLEIQLVKFSFHSSTLAYLIDGTPISVPNSNKTTKYPDIGSIYLIGRALIENYLMFYYLNIQPQTFDEGEFRYLLYELGGLNQRQGYKLSIRVNDPKIIKEKKDIDIIISKIKLNKFFLSLPKQKQNQLLADKPAKMIGWEKLIETSHLDTDFFLTTWKLYSNYSHSEMIGSIQIKEYVTKPTELNTTLNTALTFANMLTCIAIIDLVKLFKSSEIVYNTLPVELTTKIEYYWKAGTGQIKKK